MKGNDIHIENIDDLIAHIARGKTFFSSHTPEGVDPATYTFLESVPEWNTKIKTLKEQIFDCMIKGDVVKDETTRCGLVKRRISHNKGKSFTNATIIYDENINSVTFVLDDSKNRLTNVFTQSKDGKLMVSTNEKINGTNQSYITIYDNNGAVLEAIKASSMTTIDNGKRYKVLKEFPQLGKTEQTVVVNSQGILNIEYDYVDKRESTKANYIGHYKQMYMDPNYSKEEQTALFEAEKNILLAEKQINTFSGTASINQHTLDTFSM